MLLSFMACTKDSDVAVAGQGQQPARVEFSPYLQQNRQATRAVWPTGSEGAMDNSKLKDAGIGVFTQYTESAAWEDYVKTTPFNFMWNQQVTWNETDSRWLYTPVKYWPNSNQPADYAGAQGSTAYSYLSFFGYAPYVDAASLPGTGAGNDGIISMSANSDNADGSYIYYRTSIDKPFAPETSVDLLWATQQDRYKTDAEGYGHVDGLVQLVFKHTLTKLDITTKLLVDRTKDQTSPAYSTELDANTRIFIEEAHITTPDYYSEGKLIIAPNQSTPKWDYTGLDAYRKTGFDYDVADVKYSMRYADYNIPTNRDWVEKDPITELYDYEQAKEDFDAMEDGVLPAEQQLAANYSTYMFLPSEDQQALSVRVKYHVVTYDEKLVLNSPKYYSDITNDITATLDDPTFRFESNKQYKLVLNLGVTSVKFEVYVLDDQGEWILLSAIVKGWDVVTKEVDVE